MHIRLIAAVFLLGVGALVAGAGVPDTGVLTGKVVDERGKAIAGAHVVASGAADAETTTNAKGEFRFELEPGSYRLQFDADMHASAALREPVDVVAGKETKLKRRVELPAADETSVVRGSVFTREGLSIADARIVIERVPGPDGKPVAPFTRRAESDSMGVYAFHVPKGGGRYTLTASHERFGSASISVELSGGEILNAPPLTLEPKVP